MRKQIDFFKEYEIYCSVTLPSSMHAVVSSSSPYAHLGCRTAMQYTQQTKQQARNVKFTPGARSRAGQGPKMATRREEPLQKDAYDNGTDSFDPYEIFQSASQAAHEFFSSFWHSAGGCWSAEESHSRDQESTNKRPKKRN